MDITFRVRSWQRDPRVDHRVLLSLLGSLARIDADLLRRSPRIPRIYSAGVVYRKEPRGSEVWQDISAILASGHGDCEDLACWRAAELQVRDGEPASPTVIWRQRPDGSTAYHAVVRRVDGSIEDPSRVLLPRGERLG